MPQSRSNLDKDVSFCVQDDDDDDSGDADVDADDGYDYHLMITKRVMTMMTL